MQVCGSVWGVCWVFYYFCWLHDNKFAFKSPSPSPLPSLLSSRRLARSVFAFFPPAWHFFFRAVVLPAVHFLGAPADCVCVCGYTHNIINHKVSHDFILTPDLPPSLLPAGCSAAPALAWLQLAGLYFWGRAALRDFRR